MPVDFTPAIHFWQGLISRIRHVLHLMTSSSLLILTEAIIRGELFIDLNCIVMDEHSYATARYAAFIVIYIRGVIIEAGHISASLLIHGDRAMAHIEITINRRLQPYLNRPCASHSCQRRLC